MQADIGAGPWWAALTVWGIVNAVNFPHCLTKKVLETGSLPQLRKVLEMGGEATVTRS